MGQKQIQATLNPCRKYVIEKVEYDFTKMSYYDNTIEEKSKATYHNNGESPFFVTLLPYQDIYRKIQLHNLKDISRANTTVFDADLLPIFGKNRPIKISAVNPDTVSNALSKKFAEFA